MKQLSSIKNNTDAIKGTTEAIKGTAEAIKCTTDAIHEKVEVICNVMEGGEQPRKEGQSDKARIKQLRVQKRLIDNEIGDLKGCASEKIRNDHKKTKDQQKQIKKKETKKIRSLPF